MEKTNILTKREREVIAKRLLGKKINQQESNYLSKKIRPKLKEIKEINAEELIEKLDYNRKREISAIENKIIKIITSNIKEVLSITLYGSVVQTNYNEYNDIDILMVLKEKCWKNIREKYKLISQIKKQAIKQGLNLDIEIYTKKMLTESYPQNPSLIYQLKDRKDIYGKISSLPKIEIPKINLRTKLDYSILDNNADGIEIYRAIRNLILIKLIIQKTINNNTLNLETEKEIGKNLIQNLKSDNLSKVDKKIALLYLKKNIKIILDSLHNAKWEKIKLENHS